MRSADSATPEPPSSVAGSRPGSRIYPSSPLGERVEGVATGRDVAWEPLVDYRRNGVSETTIHGAVAWASGDRVVHSFGGNVLCYGRSMMKPFTMKVFADELSECSWEQKAISVASHNGDTEHVRAAQSLLPTSDLGLMRTPLDVPLVQFGRQVRRPRRWYHTCSGEHAAILRGCRAKGWERVGYTLPSATPCSPPSSTCSGGTSGPTWTPLQVARDGCGLPTVSATPWHELAQMLRGARARVRHDDWIWEAMTRHPDLVGGFNRLRLHRHQGGRRELGHSPRKGPTDCSEWRSSTRTTQHGLGVAIKIAHGWNAQATWYVARSHPRRAR